ncbi:hypothetical protein M9H77_07587 [Catharanthus roseus]|uniref:Uncharacterized protein n=1 Tax=Catharanthus roseus TaxID=4058 RepID=A0ACC0BVL6_CATRO|nr:hypothetical protein M9H77_07587 [Catharanthus roseus]
MKNNLGQPIGERKPLALLKENGAQQIKTWSLIKKILRDRFGVENHERQRQGQAKEKFMKSSTGEKSTKKNKLSQAKDVIDRKVIHHEKKNTCTFVKEEKSREEKVKSVVSTKESEGKRKESECLIENHESLKEKQGDKREEMRQSCCDISSSLNSLSTEEMNLIQPQFLNFLTTTYGTKRNHRMKAKEEGMGKELSIGFEYTLISLSLNPFLLYHELSFKELKLFLELYASYVTLVGNMIKFLDEFILLPYCKEELDGPSLLKETRAFDEKSLSGLTSFYEIFIKELSTIASSLIVVTKMITGFTWELDHDAIDVILMTFERND